MCSSDLVIGIIATLMGVLIHSFSGASESAQKAKVQDLVLSTATAFNTILQRNMQWPPVVVEKTNGRIDKEVAIVFVQNSLLGLAANDAKTALQGQDRCGIVDHWASAVLKKSSSKTGDSDKTLKVGGGAQGTVDDHTLWYAVDTDGDGITEINAEDIGSLKVRASVCVWAAGKDGKVSSWDDAARSDDVYSWQMNQVVK